MKEQEFIDEVEKIIKGFVDCDGNIKHWKIKNIAEQIVKNCNLQNVNARTLGFASCVTLAKSMPLDQAIQVIKSDITGLPQTAVIDGELVVQYVR